MEQRDINLTTDNIPESGHYSDDFISLLTGCEEKGFTSPYLSGLDLQSAKEDIYVISDLHLAAGTDKDHKYYGTENFFYDEIFSRFIQHIKSKNKNSWLVINGDFIDFLRITNIPEKPEDFELWQNSLNRIGINKPLQELHDCIIPKEREYGFKTHEYKSVWKLVCASRGHKPFFAALADWITGGNRLVIVKGNHDLEWYWEGIRNTMRIILSENIATRSGKGIEEILKEYIFQNLFFTDHFVTFNDTVYIEHGYIYDKYSHVQGEPLLSNKEEINIPFGSFLNRYILNNLEFVYPFLDNVRPGNKVLPLLIRDHFFLGLKVLFRYIPFIIKVIPRKYFFYMFGRFLAFAIPLFILILLVGISFYSDLRSGNIHIEDPNTLMIPTLKAIFWAILAYIFLKLAAYLQLAEPQDLNEDAQKIMDAHPEFRFVIFGHTHNPEQFESKGKWFFNTGTWIPIIEISNAEIRWDKTFAFIHLVSDNKGSYTSSALQRWNDDSSRFDPIALIHKKK